MRFLRVLWLGGLAWLAGEVHAVDLPRWYHGHPPPLHPTALQGTWKEQTLPIVAVRGDTPQVLVDGKLRKLRTGANTRYEPTRAAYYAPGSLEMKNVQAKSRRTELTYLFDGGQELRGGTISASSDFSATLYPTQDYKDCFVVIIFFNRDYLEGQASSPEAFAHFAEIPDLVAGKPNAVRLDFGYVDASKTNLGFFTLFFTRGHEIRTEQAPLVAAFFRRLEEGRHARVVEAYLKQSAGKSAPLQAYLRMPPIFAENQSFQGCPTSAEFSFMVTEEGRVENVVSETRLPAEVDSVLRRTLGGWLFLPRLKEGRAERTMIRIPLGLEQAVEATAGAAEPAAG